MLRVEGKAIAGDWKADVSNGLKWVQWSNLDIHHNVQQYSERFVSSWHCSNRSTRKQLLSQQRQNQQLSTVNPLPVRKSTQVTKHPAQQTNNLSELIQIESYDFVLRLRCFRVSSAPNFQYITKTCYVFVQPNLRRRSCRKMPIGFERHPQWKEHPRIAQLRNCSSNARGCAGRS